MRVPFLSSATDETLVRKALRGDEHAVATLYDRYSLAMFRYCFYQLGDEKQAEDLMQDAFVEMIHSLKSFSFQGSFKKWLYTIAKRQVLSAIRQKYQLPKAILGDWVAASEEADWIDEEKQQAVKEKTIQKLLHRLRPDERKAIELTHLRGYTSREAAAVTGKTPESIRVSVHRALKKLAHLYDETDSE